MNILIADDALFIREKFRTFFKDLTDVTLFEASNGEEAIKHIKENIIDIAMVDAVMPLKSGLEVINEAKKINEDLIFYGLTTQERGATRNKFLEAGAVDILKKPFTNDELHSFLKGHL